MAESKPNLFQKIKEKFTCYDACRYAGIVLNSSGRGKSFRQGSSNSSSLHIVNDNFYQDHGDASDTAQGDQIQLYQLAKGLASPFEAAKEIAAIVGIDISDSIGIGKTKVLPGVFRVKEIVEAAIDHWHESLTAEDRLYLNNRGINDETIKRFKIGSYQVDTFDWLEARGYSEQNILEARILKLRDRIVFPYFYHGKAEYYIARTTLKDEKTKYKKMAQNGVNEHTVWGIDELRKAKKGQVKQVIVAEGIMDALSVAQEGFCVITPVTASFSKRQQSDIIELLKEKKIPVVICLDYDPTSMTGQKGTEKLARAMFKNGINAKIIQIESADLTEKADINEWVSEKGITFAAILKMEPFISMQLNNEIKDTEEDPDEIERLMRLIHTQYTNAQRDAMYEEIIASTGMARSNIKNTIKRVTKQKSQAEMSETVTEEHDLKYDSSMGDLYRFNSHYWAKLDNRMILDMTMGELGENRDDAKETSLRGLIQKDTTMSTKEAISFDIKQDLVTFKNVTIDLSKGVVESQREFLVSKIIDENYDRHASCPKFMEFVKSITMGNPSRCQAIQEMMGYTLINSAKFQQCFMLVGDGSNGKSVLMKVLRDVLGDENVSSLMMGQVQEKFKMEKIKGMKANIAEENVTDTNGSGVIANLKTMVSGDSISAEVKYGDVVKFAPTAVFIFCLNKVPTFDEPDGGLIRRLNFIDFNMTYKDHLSPTEKKNKKFALKNENLVDELIKERKGILNYMLKGAVDITRRGKIEICKDSSARIQEIKDKGLSVETFINYKIQHVQEAEWGIDEIYVDYTIWMKNEGHTTKDNLKKQGFIAVCMSNNRSNGFETVYDKESRKVRVYKC